VKQVAELFIELVICFVAYFQQSVFNPERVAEIIARLVPADFWRPAREVFTVEQLNPLLFSLLRGNCTGRLRQQERAGGQRNGEKQSQELSELHRFSFREQG
jgi:hypothetical protein